MDPKILQQFEICLGLEFLAEEPKEGEVCFSESQEIRAEYKTYFTPLNLLDYVYAVLHSPNYRETYKEFLRKIHLLESPLIEDFITSYPEDGDNVIRKITKTSPGFELSLQPHSPTDSSASKAEQTIGKVWINDTQYFDNVPEVAWEFNIGGYQPAQKWLKDRKGRKLNFEDILHYQKIIVALCETDRLMREIDKIEIINEA